MIWVIEDSKYTYYVKRSCKLQSFPRWVEEHSENESFGLKGAEHGRSRGFRGCTVESLGFCLAFCWASSRLGLLFIVPVVNSQPQYIPCYNMVASKALEFQALKQKSGPMPQKLPTTSRLVPAGGF